MKGKTQIIALGAPSVGTHSQAIRSGNLVYLTAQSGCDPLSGLLAKGLDAQTEQMLANVDTILACSGCSKADIVTVTLIFADIKYFKRVDEIYAQWIPSREEIPLPCCTAFATEGLPDGVLLQMDVVASVPGG